MGTTVSVEKMAAAFKSSEGRIHYVLFENIYEKKEGVGGWTTCAFGQVEKILDWIFLAGSKCVDGMTQEHHGPINPESYIGDWLKVLHTPLTMSDRDIILENELGIAKKLSQRYFSIALQLIKDELPPLPLFGNAEMLANLSGCMVFPEGFPSGCSTSKNKYGYCPIKAKKPKIHHPQFMRIDESNFIYFNKDHWEYIYGNNYLADFVKNLATVEIMYPGNSRILISEMRSLLENAPKAPLGTKVIVDLGNKSVPMDELLYIKEYRRSIKRISRRKFEVDVATVFEKDSPIKWIILSQKCATWLVPAMAVEEIPELF